MTVKWQEVSSLLDRSSWRHTPSTADRQLWAYFGALVALALLVPLHGLWAAQLLIIPLLLIVPGLILLRALRIPGDAIASSPVYVPCASLAVLLGSGLGIDLIGLATGMAAPLRAGPLLIGLEFTCLALLASSLKAPAEVAVPWPARPIALVWPLVLPLLAAAGALRLNSGHGNLVAVISLAASGIALIATFVLASRLSRTQLAMILFAVSLALIWSFSLRGDLVYGYDIAAEYHASWLTAYLGIWHPVHPGDAYSALLSVTVLPAELQALSGMSTLLVLKVVYPAIAALFPVAVFGLAARVLTRRWAFAAAAFIVTQSTFFQTFPALARQEIALLFFAGLIVAMIDAHLPRRSQWAVVAVFSLGMITAHYSTMYVAIGVIGLLLLLQWIVSWHRPIPRVSGAAVVAFTAACLGGIAWYGLITRSASNLSQVIALAEADGLHVLPTAHGGNLLSAYLQASTGIPLKPAQYAQLVHQYYVKYEQFVTPLPDAADPRYALRAVSTPTPGLGYRALNESSLIVAQLTNLLSVAGALMIVLWRRTTVTVRQVGLLSLATLVILAVARLSGTVAAVYNPERAFIQVLVVVAIALCWPLQLIAGRHGRRLTSTIALSAVGLGVLFATGTGLAGIVLGDGTAANLANSGADYQRFDMSDPEIAAATWLVTAVPKRQLIYADRYAQLRIFAVDGLYSPLLNDITPLTIDQHAWIYASRTNVVDGYADVLFNNRPVVYAFPFRFLDDNFDTVYTNGTSEVFHR